MRVVFVFPPRASATYVPLGIASLASYIESAVPGTSVRLKDLNLAPWKWPAGIDTGNGWERCPCWNSCPRSMR